MSAKNKIKLKYTSGDKFSKLIFGVELDQNF